MTRRARIVTYGAAALLVLAGTMCAILVSDGAGEILALVLIGLGLVGIISVVFLEVGLSEDRELERQAARAARSQRPRLLPRHRLGRSRGQRRHLG